MRRVKGFQISLVLLGFVFANFGFLLQTRTIRASGLISLWRFDEGEGTIAYDSVGGNHGTVYDANWITGIIEGALSFDGVGDYVDVGNDNSLKPPLPVTLSAWINLSSSDSTQYIIALDHQTPLYYGIWWYVRSAGNLAINYGDGGIPDYTSRRSKAGTTVLDADTWYHVAAVIRGPTDMSLYVDGIDDGGTYSGSGWSLAYSSASSLMGMRHDSAYCLDGIIDDVRVYEEALSNEEISELYEMCLSGHTGISVWPKPLEFDANEGGSNPASQTISIRNTGVGILDYRITEDCPWLEVDPNSGTSVGETDDVTASADISGLAWGEYGCELIISDPNALNSPQTVDVNLTVIGPMIELSAAEFEFTAEANGPNPENQMLYVRNGGGGILNWTISEDCDWLSVEPNSGSSTGEANEVTLSVDISGLAGVDYNCQLIVFDPNVEDSPQMVAVDLAVHPAGWPVDPNGVVSWWGFYEGEGTIAHDPFGGNDGTIYGANWTTGVIGSALSFDGVDDYVDVGNDSSLKPPLPVTLSAWINLSSSDSTQYIFALDDQTSEYYGFWWYVDSAGNLVIGYGDGGGKGLEYRRSKIGTTALNAGTWYHVAAVVRGPTDMALYVNGIDDGGTYSGTGGNLAYSNASSLIGMRHDSACCFDGIIDDVRVYERDLSAEEISEVYEIGLDGRAGISTWPKTLEFYADEGGSNPASQTISISNIGVGVLSYQITEDCPWLEVDPNSGTSAGETDEVAVNVDISGLIGGWYDCNLVVSGPNAFNTPQTVEVILVILVAGEMHVPSEYPTIQAAIDLAADGVTVVVEPNTYTGTGNRDIDFRGKVITVRSIDPTDPNIVAATIIDCDANISDQHRGIIFESGEGSDSVLAGFTIMNGYESVGGGIYCSGSSPTISHCVITGNTSSDNGGGIGCEDANPTINDCLISYNRALSMGKGGGIVCGYMADITRAVNIDNCTFVGNSAARDGGAIEGNVCTFAITNCTFTWNTAGDDGGALSYCPGRITNCSFIANSAGGHGGALYNCWEAEMSNCLLSCNWAAGDGGGVYNPWVNPISPSITNCTVTWNSAGGYGGGIYFAGTVTNCIVWGNTDHHGTGESSQIGGEWPEVTFSCIQDDDPNDENIPFGGEENGNIDDNPMFVRDPNDGGDGWGVGDNDDLGDLHLQSSSPCINVGYSSIWPFPEGVVDMDGQPRIMGAVVDMGADEFFMPTVVVTKPEGGEVWASGSLHEITWYSHIYEGPVDILFSENAGSDWETVESSLPETGSYMWYLPDMVDSNQCVILAVPNLPDLNVVSVDSGLFTIHPDFCGPNVPSRWETRGRDFQRVGLSDDYGPELGCLKWQFQTDGPVWASATIGASDRVHVACGDGKVYTLDLGDGSLIWSYDTGSELLSSPTIGPDGSVFVGSEDGKVYAISIGGILRWTHTTDGWIYSSPAVSDEGDVYVCSQDGKLYALGYDGSELWTFEPNETGGLDVAIFASPAIGADGTVYIAGLYDANLYALDPNDGSVKWDCNFGSVGGAFASPVVAPDGTIYQTMLYDANLYAIDPNTGSILWSADMADPESGWFDSDYVDTRDYVDGWYEPAVGPDGTIYVTFNDPYLRAVDTDGNIIWVTRLGMTGSFSLAVGNDGLIYAAGEDGYLCAVDASGQELARFEGQELLSFPVIAADNTIVVSDANDRIWAISGEGCENEISVLHRPEDLDGSRAANLLDFAILAMDWLDCSNTDVGSACDYEGDAIYLTGDINRNLYVEFEDVAVLAGRWLSEN